MATGGPTGQDAEKTRGSRGTDGPTKPSAVVRLTSTSAFREYAGQTDAIISELAFERIDVVDAWQTFDYAVDLLTARLRDAFKRRVETCQDPGEAPPADEQPSAVPG